MVPAAILSVLVFGVAVAFPHIGKQTLVQQSAGEKVGIYNGNSTTMNDHRYLVGLKYKGNFLCAGTIVSSSWIVTIADCTNKLDASDLTVLTASNDGKVGTEFQVKTIKQHPQYSPSTIDYDVSCVQVKGTFYYWKWRSHQLPSAALDPYSTFSVTGYGFTSSEATSQKLRTASMILLPKSTCENYYIDVDLTWNDRLQCAYNPSGATLCNGDYGDAFVGGKVIYGMFTAAGPLGFCSSNALPVIMTDIYQVADWIHTTTGAQYA